MSNALQIRHAILPARADVAVRPALTLFVRGPLGAHAAALDTLWARLRELPTGQRLQAYRLGTDTKWRTLGSAAVAPLSERFGLAAEAPGGWRLVVAEQPGSADPAAGARVEWASLPPVRGLARASHLRFVFDDTVSHAEIAALGDLALQHLPVWWGSGGHLFDFTGGSPHVAGKRIAALAKRHWAVQLQDLTALQWDALNGMPSVNWLTLLGPAFATQAGLDLDGLAVAAERLAGVFVRRGPHGIALAAGPQPVTGDINTQDDLGPLAETARLLAPLVLPALRPLDGPLARPDVLTAWLRRFDDPQGWLAADIAV
ncbi:MAG: type VI immunity family protein [Rhizobacter sp.]